VLGTVIFLGALFLGFSLWSYDWRDIALLKYPPNSPMLNWFGLVGAWNSFLLLMLLGLSAYLVPVVLGVFGLTMLLGGSSQPGARAGWGVTTLVSASLLFELYGGGLRTVCEDLNLVDPGGLAGHLLGGRLMIPLLSDTGTAIIGWSFAAVSLAMFIGLSTLAAAGARAAALAMRVKSWNDERSAVKEEERSSGEREQRAEEKERRAAEREQRAEERKARLLTPQPEPKPAGEPVPEPPAAEKKPEPEPQPVRAPRREPPKSKPPEPEPEQQMLGPQEDGDGEPYRLPTMDLLAEVPVDRADGTEVDVETISRVLKETLSEFGIEAEVTNAQIGPVVTSYELLPAPGVRVERIQGLSNNIALSLKATSVRVQAPIPGKGVVGIEVPNGKANLVYLREILESAEWRSGKAKLPLALGKDVSGRVIVGDLADMPHLLIAGATGSGKTVCMNSVLAGLLMSRTPEQLRLVLVDPKIVEFSAFNHLPHLVVPVITDSKKVALGLRWAINEMENRYKLFAKVGVRNIESYNKREVATQCTLFDEAQPAAEQPPRRIPYIVIVIDELADLMLVAQADVENAVARLAQLSRAVGIHMIIATQRPSVNVITGTIKANFPARIAFQVAQKVDSRTILDTIGAEKLLGRGDMLYMPPGASKLVRAQGALTTDAEIHKIVDFIKAGSEPSYEVEIRQRLEKENVGLPLDDGNDDEIIAQAVQIIRETHRASTSSLQRRLRIGYTRAARIMDILEERGIVGTARGSDPREILIDLDVGEPDNSAQVEDV